MRRAGHLPATATTAVTADIDSHVIFDTRSSDILEFSSYRGWTVPWSLNCPVRGRDVDETCEEMEG